MKKEQPSKIELRGKLTSKGADRAAFIYAVASLVGRLALLVLAMPLGARALEPFLHFLL